MKESETTEFKESLSDEDGILTSACAFANTNGGSIFIGVKDNSSVIGISVGKNTIELLGRKLTENISPPIYASIKETTVENKIVLEIKVPKSEYKPHFYKGIAYIRVGKINKNMSPEELTIFFKNRFLEQVHFDSEQCKEATIEDVDKETAKAFTEKIGMKFSSVETTLKNLKLIRNGHILNAAVIFFGKKPSLLYPLFGVKCAVFSRFDISAMKDMDVNLFNAVDQAVDFVMESIPKILSFERAERKSIPILPREALREAVVNALVHRDYTYPSSVYVAVYEDKVIIKNPGVLPPELSESDLYKEHPSHPRNPLLAELAHKIDYIEHWGTGTIRILRSMRQAGLNDPVFKQEKGFFHVILPLTRPNISERQGKILELLRENKQGTIKNIKKLIREKVTERTIKSDVRKLVEAGFILRRGSGKNTFYTIYV